MEAFIALLDLFQKAIYTGGIVIIVINGLHFAQNLKESQGTQLSSSGMGIIGGLMICSMGFLLDFARAGIV